MDRQYFIVVDMKSLNGYHEFVKFSLGNSFEFSNEVFSKLQIISVDDKSMALRIELLATGDEVSEVLQTGYCTLKQLKENCEVIAKEVFRHFIF